MPQRIVLDTSAYAQLRRGHPDVQLRIARSDNTVVPAIVLGELEAGFRCGSRYKENTTVLEEFLSEPFVTTLAVDVAVSRIYGRHLAALRRAGTPIPTNDIWIAACATSVGAPLVTFDTHFTKVSDLDLDLLQA